jgi:hypothetical protein
MPEQPLTRKNAPTNPPCPKCKTPMRVTLVMPNAPYGEHRTFQCDACGHSETIEVKY